MTFYNTIDETAEELAESQAKAQTQGEKILDTLILVTSLLARQWFLLDQDSTAQLRQLDEQ